MQLRAARPADLDAVVAVLDGAAAWLRGLDIDQWPDRFPPERVGPDIEAGEVHVAVDRGVVVGSCSLVWSDPVIWPDAPDPDDAGYLHQFAVRRDRRGEGIGDALLSYVDGLVAAAGRRWLRLDCVTHNPGLRRYYESRGFRHRGEIDGLPRTNPAWQSASRYERAVAGGG